MGRRFPGPIRTRERNALRLGLSLDGQSGATRQRRHSKIPSARPRFTSGGTAPAWRQQGPNSRKTGLLKTSGVWRGVPSGGLPLQGRQVLCGAPPHPPVAAVLLREGRQRSYRAAPRHPPLPAPARPRHVVVEELRANEAAGQSIGSLIIGHSNPCREDMRRGKGRRNGRRSHTHSGARSPNSRGAESRRSITDGSPCSSLLTRCSSQGAP